VAPDTVTWAVLADVHGNRWALEAVLADARGAGAARFADLGDSLDGPLEPERTALLLAGLEAVAVRGNGDRELLDEPSTTGRQRALVAGRLLTLELCPGVVACHGTPRRDDEYLLEEVRDGAVQPRPSQEVMSFLGDLAASIVLCAHSHLPRLAALPDGRLVANPGSVGVPAYAVSGPPAYAVESGRPHARYLLLHAGRGEPALEFRTVVYPWQAAARAARAGGRPDWAHALESGRALVPTTD
jgi:predicted phosphodiesterase